MDVHVGSRFCHFFLAARDIQPCAPPPLKLPRPWDMIVIFKHLQVPRLLVADFEFIGTMILKYCEMKDSGAGIKAYN